MAWEIFLPRLFCDQQGQPACCHFRHAQGHTGKGSWDPPGPHLAWRAGPFSLRYPSERAARHNFPGNSRPSSSIQDGSLGVRGVLSTSAGMD